MINSNDIPQDIKTGEVVQITTNKVNYFTHGFFKYPCKFIPNIPKWAIQKYTKKGDLVLDPFAGSGTTLVEAILNERNAIAIDFDTLSQLLCKVKTTNLSLKQLKKIENFWDTVNFKKEGNKKYLPDLHNTNHWFPEENIHKLLILRESIEKYHLKNHDIEVRDFLLVCLASIIRKCSYADSVSPKPYVSTRVKKKTTPANLAFKTVLKHNLEEIKEYSNKKVGKCEVIGDDARFLESNLYNSKVNLIVSSPPYINAFDYVRSLRLENAWLGLYGDTGISEIKKRQIGTESISSIEYNSKIAKTKIKDLDNIVNNISLKDKKRAYVVWKYFNDMEKHFKLMSKLLKKDGHYIIVVGNSKIRGEIIKTYEILTEIALRNGFEIVNKFSYQIRNRYLRIPRSGQGGLVDLDWVVDLVKK